MESPAAVRMGGSATVHMSATAEQVWALVSDVTRIGEFSPETFEAQWLDGATGPALGATFRGHVKRNEKGPTYWTVCRVVECEPAVAFGFEVLAGSAVVNTWRYALAPAGDGTDVTESFAMNPTLATKLYWLLLGRFRGRRNVNDMRRTLERIRAVVEQG